MQVLYKHLFSIPKKYRKQMNDIFSKYNIEYNPKDERAEDTDLHFEFDLPNKMPNVEQFNKELEILIPEMNNKPFVYQASFEFIFDNNDYVTSPFFRLQSTGNSSRAFIESYKPKFEKAFLCNTCGIHSRNLVSPLEINHTKIGKRLMVNVDYEYWVITEKLASLLYDWNLKGFILEKVISTHSNEEQFYRLIPKVTMPPWSDSMKHYFIDRRRWCSDCDLRSWVPGPFHYDLSALQNLQTDFATTHELVVYGSLAYRPLVVSSKFRDLILQKKLSKEIVNLRDSNYKSYDWIFEPISVAEK